MALGRTVVGQVTLNQTCRETTQAAPGQGWGQYCDAFDVGLMPFKCVFLPFSVAGQAFMLQTVCS